MDKIKLTINKNMPSLVPEKVINQMIMTLLKFVLFLVLLFKYGEATGLYLVNKNVGLYMEIEEDHITYFLIRDETTKIRGRIPNTHKVGVEGVEEACQGASSCILHGDPVTLTITDVDSGFKLTWKYLETNSTDGVFRDCIDLQRDLNSGVNWFGGPERGYNREWPVQNLEISEIAYIVSKNDFGAVAERYWLSSRGGYVFVSDQVPLFVDQNHDDDGYLCFTAKIEEPYIGRESVELEYTIVAQSDAREAHLHAVHNYLGKPEGHPNERIIKEPIWTTWAKYKKDISDEVVLSFAQDIVDHGFIGQLEIDDFWEECYGSLTFNNNQFGNISGTVEKLHELGFTVTLWTHPFVNSDCEQSAKEGLENDYFVKTYKGSLNTDWWDGNPAYHVDFTKEEARKWFTGKLQKLKDQHGIDGFKFDAGEADFAPYNPELSEDAGTSPNSLTGHYLRTCATFGDLLEVRSGWRTQDLPIFVRVIDKDSRWGLDNGLHSLITTILQLNMAGYTMVLPDMVGGNGYGELPSAELLARWTQANTFMPTMQFSYLPWDITSEEFDGVEIIQKFVTLHRDYADEILEAMKQSITNGIPVNPPIWWADPQDDYAQRVNDQYMLGEKIIVAPVIEEKSTSRNIYLPSGLWLDANTNEVIEGPKFLDNYSAPIDVLPNFIKQTEA